MKEALYFPLTNLYRWLKAWVNQMSVLRQLELSYSTPVGLPLMTTTRKNIIYLP